MLPLQRLIAELRQRHVFRVAGAYAAVAFVLVQVADLVVEPLRLPAWTLPLVIVLVVLGFPVALVLSWALELTPDGVRRAPASELLADLPRPARRLAGGLLLLVVAASAGFTLWAVRRDPAPDAPRSVAVLPFVDLSAQGDQRYFSDGLTEELTAALARVEGLRVAARTASFQFAAAGADLGDVGRRLNVTTVLEGSVRRAGDRLRVTARLVDVDSGYELWTEVFERRVHDVFDVQEEIAREILNALRFPDTGDRLVAQGTRDLVAYDHLLRGNHHLARRTPEEVRNAIAQYAAAAAADPRSATARFRQAYAYLVHADWGWPHPELAPDSLLARADRLIEQGLRLEPASAEGWLARGYLRVLADPFRMAGALEAFERSLDLDARNPEAWHQYGQTLMVLGRTAEAATAYHRALRLEPHRAMTLVPMGAIALYGGQLDEARRWVDSAVAVDPANAYARASRARTYLSAGDTAMARRDAELAAGLGAGHTLVVAGTRIAVLARSGAREEAAAALAQALRLAGTGPLSSVDATSLAVAAAAMDSADTAIALLRRARPQGAWFWFYLQTPLLAGLQHDARFQQVVSAADPRTSAH